MRERARQRGSPPWNSACICSGGALSLCLLGFIDFAPCLEAAAVRGEPSRGFFLLCSIGHLLSTHDRRAAELDLRQILDPAHHRGRNDSRELSKLPSVDLLLADQVVNSVAG